jgi:hypothetical protein
MFSVSIDVANACAAPVAETAADFIVRPSGLGLGEDRLIGGQNDREYRRIDLRALTHPVEVQWTSEDSGIITDGADSIVFQGIEEILLPCCMCERDICPFHAIANEA